MKLNLLKSDLLKEYGKKPWRVVMITCMSVLLAELWYFFSTLFFEWASLPYVMMLIIPSCMIYWVYMMAEKGEKKPGIWLCQANLFLIMMLPFIMAVFCLTVMVGISYHMIVAMIGIVFLSNIVAAVFYVIWNWLKNIRAGLLASGCLVICEWRYLALEYAGEPGQKYDLFGLFDGIYAFRDGKVISWMLRCAGCFMAVVALYLIGEVGQWCFFRMKNWYAGSLRNKTGGQAKN